MKTRIYLDKLNDHCRIECYNIPLKTRISRNETRISRVKFVTRTRLTSAARNNRFATSVYTDRSFAICRCNINASVSIIDSDQQTCRSYLKCQRFLLSNIEAFSYILAKHRAGTPRNFFALFLDGARTRDVHDILRIFDLP